jgi:hypothetical protein
MSEKKSAPSKENRELSVDVLACGRLTLLLFRDPVQFTDEDIKFMRERDVLLVKSPNLTNDLRAIDIQTFRSKGRLRDCIFDAAIASIGYNKGVFAEKVLAVIQNTDARGE